MKGIVFNLLEEVVTIEYGADVWDELLEQADLDGAYTSLGSYDDAEVFKLVAAAAAKLSLGNNDILLWFGQKAMPLLAQRYPAFFTPHQDARSFLLTLNDIIHPEVKKLYPGAMPPVFDFGLTGNDRLTIGYHSKRKLCALAEGFIRGTADHYHEDITFDHATCMHRGDAKCLFLIDFVQGQPQGE